MHREKKPYRLLSYRSQIYSPNPLRLDLEQYSYNRLYKDISLFDYVQTYLCWQQKRMKTIHVDEIGKIWIKDIHCACDSVRTQDQIQNITLKVGCVIVLHQVIE